MRGPPTSERRSPRGIEAVRQRRRAGARLLRPPGRGDRALCRDARTRMTPGVPLRFASALPLAGYGRGVIVTSMEGRPIKIDGNPRHPASLGATDVFAEAARAVALRSRPFARRRAAAAAIQDRGARSRRRCGRGSTSSALAHGAGPRASDRPRHVADADRQIERADARPCRRRNGIATSRSRTTPFGAGAMLAFGRPVTRHAALRRCARGADARCRSDRLRPGADPLRARHSSGRGRSHAPQQFAAPLCGRAGIGP